LSALGIIQQAVIHIPVIDSWTCLPFCSGCRKYSSSVVERVSNFTWSDTIWTLLSYERLSSLYITSWACQAAALRRLTIEATNFINAMPRAGRLCLWHLSSPDLRVAENIQAW
jgi:hypothetical protein